MRHLRRATVQIDDDDGTGPRSDAALIESTVNTRYRVDVGFNTGVAPR